MESQRDTTRDAACACWCCVRPDDADNFFLASTAPRRMLGQAVDADGNLYCADTVTGTVIRLTPDGRESTYATV